MSRFFTGIIVTHAGILFSIPSIPIHIGTSTVHGMLPYPPIILTDIGAIVSVMVLSPGNCRREIT